ncbi:MAG: tetratricopeptide repeat protein [Saprospiraceae bacterium]|nr:tetratricopeptide repeat protein [Saprospiraceae bacterium]
MTKAKTKKKGKSGHKPPGKQHLFTRESWIGLAIIGVIGFIAFSPILQADFLNYDDELYITENAALTGFNLPGLFSGYIGNQYSPIAMTIMALEVKLFGLDAGSLKLISILMHLFNVLLVFVFIKKLIRRDDIALLTSALFAVHTLQVESVAWLTASMKISTYSLFSLASLVTYLTFRETKKQRAYLLSVLFFVLAGLCKEQAVVLPLLLILIDYFQQRKWWKKEALVEKIPFFIVAFLIGMATMRVAGEMRGSGDPLPYTMIDRMVFACMALFSYALKQILPIHLSTYYLYPPVGEIPGYYYLTPFFVLGILGLLYYMWKNDLRLYFFGIAFFLINIVLTLFSQIFSVRDVIMADRYVYLSSIGFILCIIYAVAQYANRHSWPNKALYMGFGLYALVLSGMTWQRTHIWHDTISMFTDAIEFQNDKGYQGTTPSLGLPYSNRGLAKKRLGDLEGALTDYNAAIAANPGYPTAYLNRGNLYFVQNKPDLAIQDQNKAIQLDPGSYLAYANRGAALASSGKYQEAIQDFDKALDMQPNFLDGLRNRALTYYTIGNNQAALQDLERYLRIAPNDADVQAFRQEVMSKMN